MEKGTGIPDDAELYEVTKEDVERLADKLDTWAEELPATQRFLVRTLIARAGAQGEVSAFGLTLGRPISERLNDVLSASLGTQFGIGPLADTVWKQGSDPWDNWDNNPPGPGWDLVMAPSEQ